MPVGQPSQHRRATPDPALLRALARAHDFRERLTQDPDLSAHGIARGKNVTAAYIYAPLRLAWLAPDITDAIVNGRQPPQSDGQRAVPSGRTPSARLAWTAQADRLRAGNGRCCLSGDCRAEVALRSVTPAPVFAHQLDCRRDESTPERRPISGRRGPAPAQMSLSKNWFANPSPKWRGTRPQMWSPANTNIYLISMTLCGGWGTRIRT